MRLGLRITWRHGRLATMAVLAVLLSAVGALAFWTTHGSGTASGSVGTLAPPTEVSASPSGTSVGVSWKGVSAPGGGAIDGYYVRRLSGPSSASACGSSPTQLLPATSTSCSDSGNPVGNGVPAGTYTYTVTAVYRSWTAQSAASGSVTVAGPSIGSLAPSSQGQGATAVNVTITGTNFISGAGVSFSGSGIAINSTVFESPTKLKVNITISASASTGERTVTVTNPDGDTASASFTVNPAPTVTSTSPSSRGQGATNQNIAIKGTHFASGAIVSFSGSGIAVNSTTFKGATELVANVTIESSAATGARTVTVTNPDDGVGTLAGGFTINAAPSVTALSPSSGDQGGSENVTIKGTNFASGAVVSLSGTGITVNSTTFVSSTELSANLTIAPTAATGARTVIVTNPDAGNGSLASAFTVNGAPSMSSVTPSSRGQGATEASITLKGANLESGAGVSFSGSGITVNSTAFVNSTELTAKITISPSAATGARTVTVTNPDGTTASLTGGFTVNAGPTVSSTSPSSRGQGATNQEITVKGANFVSGATVSFSGSGITVSSVTFKSSTELTAKISVASTAPTGTRTVTVTNPDAGTGSLANGFTVNAGPTITSPTEANPENPGHNKTATFIMTGTNFVSGLTVTLSANGKVLSFKWESSTAISVTVEGSGGTGGLGSFTVTNPDGGTFTSPNSFKNG